MIMNVSKEISASLEDYLEAIFWIIAIKGVARVKDIAKTLSVKASSVTGALQALAKKNYINYAPYEVITLTSEGEKLAKNVVRRHQILKDFFISVLAVDEKLADEGACKMEHTIERTILERLVSFMEFVEICPRGGQKWMDGFTNYYKTGSKGNCEHCIATSLKEVKKRRSAIKTKRGANMTLAGLKPKQKGVVVRIERRGPISKRLADMGVGRGTLVEVKRVAPLGDPIDVKMKGYHLSLRKDEATSIIVSLS
jgi:DtxR family Mn-dependent transcriptional regulator